MKLLGSTKSKITKYEIGENVPHLKITKIILILCENVKNDYQQDSRVLYTFVLNNSFGQSLNILPKNFIFLKTFNSELSYFKYGLLDQNSKSLEIEYKANLTLVVN